MARRIVAFQGERGAFSESAALQLVGKSCRPLPCATFEELFESVENRKADLGIAPIENSLIGSIHINYDLLLKHKLTVVGETQLRVVHCLIARPGTTMRKIKQVYSHPAALSQCRKFLRKHQSFEEISYYDTAGSVKMLAESEISDGAAIASPYSAELYKMSLLKESIEDEKGNFTRFLLLSRKAKRFKGKAKTSLVFSLKNDPGALFKALSVFALRDIDLARIESRPMRSKKWEYYFYIDFLGSTEEKRVQNALSHLSEIASFTRVLGCYPHTVLG